MRDPLSNISLICLLLMYVSLLLIVIKVLTMMYYQRIYDKHKINKSTYQMCNTIAERTMKYMLLILVVLFISYVICSKISNKLDMAVVLDNMWRL